MYVNTAQKKAKGFQTWFYCFCIFFLSKYLCFSIAESSRLTHFYAYTILIADPYRGKTDKKS